MSKAISVEDRVLELKNHAADLQIEIKALLVPDLKTYTEIEATSVKRTYGIYVANGNVPLEKYKEFETSHEPTY